jgi:hypothetical protein
VVVGAGGERVSLSSHQRNGGHDEWLTPPEILSALGPFDLDPCSPASPPWTIAARTYTRREVCTACLLDTSGQQSGLMSAGSEMHQCIFCDGLNQPWAGRVWLNPPFGREASAWIRKMAAHGNGIALLAARTETAMFFESVWSHADAILFLKGRPHFHYVTGERAAANSGAPICLIAYGSTNADCLASCGLPGAFVRLRAAERIAA